MKLLRKYAKDSEMAELKIDLQSTEETYLGKLSGILGFELFVPFERILYYFPWIYSQIIYNVALILAPVFTPYIIYIFIKLRKWKWLCSLLAMIFLPFGLFGSFYKDLNINFFLILLGFLLFYYFILRIIVRNRLTEIRERRLYQVLKAKSEEEKMAWESQFEDNTSG